MAHPTLARVIPTRLLAPVVLVALALVLGACAADYFPQNAMEPRSDFAHTINDLFWLIIYWSIVVFVLVEVLLVYAVFRFRRRPGQELPAQIHGNTRLEIAWTLAPALILATIAVPTIRTIFETQAPPDPQALQVRAIGHQWWFEFQYPGLKITTANDLWIPAGRKVDVALESADVIHSFWPPKLGGKRDMIPGHVNRISFTPQAPGLYWGECAEFCGAAHANMGFRVIVAEPERFDQWVKEMQAPPAQDATNPGFQAFLTSGCIACHTIAGTPAQGKLGPDLTYFGRRHTIAAGTMPNTPENLAKWLKNPPGVKPNAQMPNLMLTDDKIEALVAYLGSLK